VKYINNFSTAIQNTRVKSGKGWPREKLALGMKANLGRVYSLYHEYDKFLIANKIIH